MKVSKALVLSITILVIVIALAFLYVQTNLNNQKFVQQKLLKLEETQLKNKEYCLEKIEPKLEEEENRFRIPKDRGCYIEAGGMPGVNDSQYKPKFQIYNDQYYKNCLSELYKEIEEIRLAIKKQFMDECLDDFK